jgi:hypothetical protein
MAGGEYPCVRAIRGWRGGVAQLGERLLCKQEVIGSIPFTSTSGLVKSSPGDRCSKQERVGRIERHRAQGSRLSTRTSAQA